MLILMAFSVAFLAIDALALYLTKKYVKDEKNKKLIYAICAIITIVIHYSVLVVDAIKGEFSVSGSLGDNMLFPAYPCNIMMWLALIFLFIKKDSQGYKVVRHILFVVGTVCVFCGLCFNFNFIDDINEGIITYEGVKGLISHGTLLYCCLYCGIIEHVEISFKNTMLCSIITLAGFGLGGLTTIVCDRLLLNREPSNPMFMMKPAFDSIPWATFPVLCILGLIVVAIFLTIYELVVFPKGERWFNKINKVAE